MGMFTQKPQQIETWAGIPGEPHDPESPAAHLGPAATDAAALDPGTSVTSIPVPLTAVDPPEAS